MVLNEQTYFFIEWVILGKQMLQSDFEKLSESEIDSLLKEYELFKKSLH